MQLLLGAGLLAVALLGAVVAVRDWPLWNALRRVRPTTPQRLVRAARDGHLDGRVVAVAGVAGAGALGLLRSAVNDEPCVWHRHTVHRRHIRYGMASGGETRRYSRRRRVADVASPQAFELRAVLPQPSVPTGEPARAARATAREEAAAARFSLTNGQPEAGVVEVRPERLRVHRPLLRGVRILPALASEPFPETRALMGRVAQMYWHREWLLRAGVPLLVLAEVCTDGPTVTLRRPAKGPHIVSTRSAAWLRRRTTASVFGGLTVAMAATIGGAAALILHFVWSG